MADHVLGIMSCSYNFKVYEHDSAGLCLFLAIEKYVLLVYNFNITVLGFQSLFTQ